MTTSTTYRIFLSVALGDEGDWSKVNEVVDQVCERHPAIGWNGSGTGFGRRDHDFEATDPTAISGFVFDLRTMLDLQGFTDVAVDIS